MKRSLSEHHWIWIGAGALLLVVTIIAVIVFNYPSDDEVASEKADELIAEFRVNDIYVPDKDVIVGMFGDDGGAVCDSADSDLGFAGLNQQLANGAAQVGIRPVTVADNVLDGELLVIQIYCPEHEDDFLDYVEDLDFEDVINE